MKVDALWMTEKGKVQVIPVEVGEPGHGQVQVEIKACGICAWDSYLFKGVNLVQDFPFQFGHEGAGIVRKVGPGVSGIKEGDNVFCAGGANMMAQVINVPAANVAVISPEVNSFPLWVGEPVVCTVNGLANIPITPGDHVVVIGTGYMGLLNIQGLVKTMAGKVTAFDINDARLQLAKEFGADEVYNTSSEKGKEAIQRIKESGGAQIVMECSGSEPGFALANDLLRTAGILSMFAWHRATRSFDGTPWHMKGIRIFNTSPMIDKHYNDRIKQTEILISKGVFYQDKLITHVQSYKNAQEMLEIATSKTDNYIKGVITF